MAKPEFAELTPAQHKAWAQYLELLAKKKQRDDKRKTKHTHS